MGPMQKSIMNQGSDFKAKLLVALALVAAIICVSSMVKQAQAVPAPWKIQEVARSTLIRHQRHAPRPLVAFLRAPMPWEDGYFDPSYHAFAKDKSGGVTQAKSSTKRSYDDE